MKEKQFHLRSCTLIFVAFFIFSTAVAQKKTQFEVIKNKKTTTKLQNAKTVNFSSNNSFYLLKTDFQINFNQTKQKQIYINCNGWLTFNGNIGNELKAELTEKNITFISPYTILNKQYSKPNYIVEYKILEKEETIIVQWSKKDFWFQVYLYPNEKIEFNYSDNFKPGNEIFISGISSPDFAIGNFPFNFPDKKIFKELNNDELKKINSFQFNILKIK